MQASAGLQCWVQTTHMQLRHRLVLISHDDDDDDDEDDGTGAMNPLPTLFNVEEKSFSFSGFSGK